MATTKAKDALVQLANVLANISDQVENSPPSSPYQTLKNSLLDLATEIQNESVTDDSFFQSVDSAGTATSGKGDTWSGILQVAALTLQAKNQLMSANWLGVNHQRLTVIADETAKIAASDAIIATQTTTIADKQTAMETYQKRLKELGEGAGIRTISPSELVGLAKLYQVMIEQGKILDEGDVVSSAQQENAKEKYKQLTKKMEAVIRELGPPDLGF